jgi:haloalkane dehalogenase
MLTARKAGYLFHAYSHNVKALSFMEALIPPSFPAPSYEALGAEYAELMRNLRTDGIGEGMVLEQNLFVEVILPKYGVMRGLGEAEMVHYRKPFPTPASRLPTLVWPRQLPIAGAPQKSIDVITANGEWLKATKLPKLMFHSVPGAVAPPPVVDIIKASVQELEIVNVGPGLHFLQEDNPHAIGQGLAAWLKRVEKI